MRLQILRLLTFAVILVGFGIQALAAPPVFSPPQPITTLGDVSYGGTNGALSRLAGDTSGTKKFLRQTGTAEVKNMPTSNTSTTLTTLTGATAGTYEFKVVISGSGTSYVWTWNGTAALGNPFGACAGFFSGGGGTTGTITNATAGTIVVTNVNCAGLADGTYTDNVTYTAATSAAPAWDTVAAGDLPTKLQDINALAVTDSNVIVGNGTTWVAESGATARTSLGLTIGTDVQAYDADLAQLLAGTAATPQFARLGLGAPADANHLLLASTGADVKAAQLLQTSTFATILNLKRTGGTAAEWEMYLPSGSTDLRWTDDGGTKLALTTAGALTASGSITSTNGGLSGTGLTLDGNEEMTTYDEGSFTGTLTGCTTTPTQSIYFTRVGKQVTLSVDGSITGTSNATTMTITGIPAALAPTHQVQVVWPVQDNGGAWINGTAYIAAAAQTIQFGNGANALGGFTAANTKGVSPLAFSYVLN